MTKPAINMGTEDTTEQIMIRSPLWYNYKDSIVARYRLEKLMTSFGFLILLSVLVNRCNLPPTMVYFSSLAKGILFGNFSRV